MSHIEIKIVCLCFIISLVLCVLIIGMSKKYRIFIDSGTSSKPQRFHTLSTPRAGGISIFGAFCIMVILCYSSHFEIMMILLGASVIFASGLIEDFRGNLSPKIRLLMQCVAAFGVCTMLDLYLKDLSLGFTLPYIIGLLFTTFALVGVSNAINIIDGFNGLASGVCLLVLCAIAYVAYDVGDREILYCTLALIGAVGGFFICNFPFGYIFLGDGGAYFLGFIIGILLVILTQNNESVSAFFGLSVMIYPIWEVLFSIWRRKKRGLNATSPDDLHLHTLLFKRVTRSNAYASCLILALNIPFVALSVYYYHHTVILLVLCAAFALCYTYFYAKLTRFGL